MLLPMNYENDAERYPVVYLHDGQNVFYSRESFSGYSWKTIPALKRNLQLPKMILVGIDNDNENRLSEYSPWTFENDDVVSSPEMSPCGEDYGRFVMEMVKPYIDRNYRTKPGREYTAMIGSSLGGSISQYLGAQYSEKIGGLGIFSTANWLFPKSFDNFMEKAQLSAQRVFIMVGTNEFNEGDASLMTGNINQFYLDSSLGYYKQLLQKGIEVNHMDLVIAAGERHSERAWAKYLPRCLQFLSTNW